jgi:acetyltransferase-like isoleucine patch superfamily enzyme
MRITHEPIGLQLREDADPLLKIRALLGHYDLRVFVSEHAYLDVGRGSWTAANAVRYLAPETAGCIGTVGQFSNFAGGAALFAGGDHWNEMPVNVVFEPAPLLGRASRHVQTLRPKPGRPFSIGNAVVISANAQVLSGANIGDGAVLATSAVAAGNLDAFTIHGGVPAKPIKPRVDADTQAALREVRWWDFDTVYLAQNMERLQEMAVDTRTKHVYRRPVPRVAVSLIERNGSVTVSLNGFVDEAGLHPLAEAPAKVRDYLQQLGRPGPYYWLADAWS